MGTVAEIIAAGDIVVCMGAGSITRIAHELDTFGGGGGMSLHANNPKPQVTRAC